jgi:hypothetical protein
MILKQVIKYSNANAIEATWVDGDGKQIICKAYADLQMPDFRADVTQYGGDIANYENLISEVEANIQPPEPAPPPPIPATVTRFQALAILAAGGYLDTVRTYINTLDQDNITRLAWENATDWERTSPTLAALATMLGLTDTEVDDLFVAASQVSA